MRRYKNSDLVFYLSLILDKDGNERLDLVTSNKLDNLDNFIKKNFSTHKDVRKKYDQEIGEYCLQNIDFIKDENKRNNRNWTGSIVILFPVYEYDYQKCEYEEKYIKLPVMYKDGKELKDRKECIDIINSKLQDRNMMKEFYQKRGFLLSEDEVRYYLNAKNYINGYIDGGKEKKSFDDLRSVFCKRLSRMPDNISYYYFRCLMDMFDLGIKPVKTRVRVKNVKTEKLAKIDKVILEEDTEVSLEEKKEVFASAPSDFEYIFDRALDTGDFDTLYNMYSIEEIEKYTNLIKGKRK